MNQNSGNVKVVNIEDKLSSFKDYWSPKIVGVLNDHEIKVVKLKDEFDWHHHDNEDELFIVIKGSLIIHFKDRDVHVNEGEFIVIPKKLEHKPEALDDVEIILIEPAGTLNTGNIQSEKTLEKPTNI